MPDYNFDAPIPGQSLTQHPGSMAMEHPPQFTNPNDAAEFLFKQMTRKDKVVDMMLLLKKGQTVEFIARTILYSGVINGKWTPDVAILLFNVCMWQIEAIATMKGIKYKTLNDNVKRQDLLSNFIDILDEKPEEAVAAPNIAKPTMFKGLMG